METLDVIMRSRQNVPVAHEHGANGHLVCFKCALGLLQCLLHEDTVHRRPGRVDL